MQTLATILILVFSLFQSEGLPDEEDRHEKTDRPDAVSREDARIEIRSVFEEEYRAYEDSLDRQKKNETGTYLASRLLEEVNKSGHSESIRYVLFYEAMLIATEVVDTQLLTQAIDGLSSQFIEDDVRLLEASLSEAKKKVKKETTLQLISGFVQLAERSVKADSYDIACESMREAIRLASKLKDNNLENGIKSRQKEIEGLKKQWGRIGRERKILRAEPEQPEANLTLGLFYCLWKEDWDRAVAYLSKGSDVALKELAEKERRKSLSTEEMIEIGNEWNRTAEEMRDNRKKESFFRRAIYWYEEALPELEGLALTKVQKTIEDVRSATSNYHEDMRSIDLLRGARVPDDVVLLMTFENYTIYEKGKVQYVKDLGQGRNHGQIHDAKSVKGIVGKGLYFDGQGNTSVEIPDSKSLHLQSFSLSLWFKPDTKREGHIFAKEIGKESQNTICLWFYSDYLTFYSKGIQFQRIGKVQIDSWHHVVIVKDGSTGIVFLNGTEALTWSDWRNLEYDGNSIWIGADDNDGDGIADRTFLGTIDEVAMWTRPLNEKEIQHLYEVGKRGGRSR